MIVEPSSTEPPSERIAYWKERKKSTCILEYDIVCQPIQVCSKRETKVMAIESSKTTYFCHETGCHSKISSIKRANKLTLTGDYAIKVMISSHNNDQFWKIKKIFGVAQLIF